MVDIILDDPEETPLREFRVWCSWRVSGCHTIEAHTLEEAEELAEDAEFPDDTDYVDDSFSIDDTEEIISIPACCTD